MELRSDERRKIARKIGILILQARLYSRLTQTELAERLHTKQPNIHRIESGKNLPSIEFLYRIAKIISTDFIFPTFGFLEPLAPQNRKLSR